MNPLSILRSPSDGSELTIDDQKATSSSGEQFERQGNLLNFLPDALNKNKATDEAASFRWDHSNRLEGDSGFQEHQINDLLLRYGFKDLEEFKTYLAPAETILEIGAGEGRLVDWYVKYSTAHVYALEISDSVHYLSEKYKDEPRVTVLKADALKPPFAHGTIDIVSADQCIHHTDYPGEIFDALSKLLKPGGKALLSVYAEKSIVREQMDVIIRDSIAQLPAERIQEIAGKFTEIGQALSDMDVNVKVPEHFTMFGHLAGQEMTLQRFVYYAMFKCFYNPTFTKEKSDEFNHDWYCYPICNKTSVEEAVNWFVRNGLLVEHLDSNPSNINVRGQLK